MTKKVLSICTMGLVLTLLSMGDADASLYIPTPIDELAERSALVVIGHVKGIEAYFTKGGIGHYSIATVEVTDVLKGTLRKPRRVQVEYLSRDLIPSGRSLKAGERLLLFLINGEGRSVFPGPVYYFTSRYSGFYRIDEDGIVKKSWYTNENGKLKEHPRGHLEELIKAIRKER